jgi:hypothetical protein
MYRGCRRRAGRRRLGGYQACGPGQQRLAVQAPGDVAGLANGLAGGFGISRAGEGFGQASNRPGSSLVAAVSCRSWAVRAARPQRGQSALIPRMLVRDRWRAANAPHLVTLVRAGATLIDGKLAGRPTGGAEPEAA